MFDKDAFLNQTIDAPMATDYELCPEGEYPALLDGEFNVNEVSGESEKGPYCFHVFEQDTIIQSDAVRQKLGRDVVKVRMRINLDLDDSGRLATGPNKNVKLGQLRSAIGKNNDQFSFNDLRGAGPIMVRVKHITSKKDGRKFAEVSSVAPIR